MNKERDAGIAWLEAMAEDQETSDKEEQDESEVRK